MSGPSNPSPGDQGGNQEPAATRSDQSGLTLSGEALANARWLAEHGGGTSIAEATRRALSVMRFLAEEQESGSTLKLQTKAGEMERIHLVYT